MCHIVDLTAHDNNMSFLQCGVDENMIGTTIFKDSQVTIGDEVETLVCHGVPIFVVGFVHLHCSIMPSLFEVKGKDEAKQEEELVHCSGFLRKIFDIFVHLSSNRIGRISPWIIDHPRNLRENADGSEVPVWWLGRKLLAGAILGSPTSLTEVQRLVQMKGKTKKGYHSSQQVQPEVVYLQNHWCQPDAWVREKHPEIREHKKRKSEEDAEWALGFMCSLLESERPTDLPPCMMGKILISLSGEPLVQVGSEDIPAEAGMVTDAVMMDEMEGITHASGNDEGRIIMSPQ